jgi:hypothetical protein
MRCRTGFGSPTPSPSRQQREQRSTDHLADGESFGCRERADTPDQAVRKFDGECQFGLAWLDRLFQTLCLFEVAISLTGRDGAVPSQLLDRIGELIDTQQQIPRAIEALGFLRFAGTWHMS